MKQFFSTKFDAANAPTKSNAVPKRNEVDIKQTWDLTPMFKTVADWETAYQKTAEALPQLAQYAGKTTKSAKMLYDVLTLNDEISLAVEHIYVYAHQDYDTDLTNNDASARNARAQSLYAKFMAAFSFLSPELATLTEEQLKGYYKDEPRLELYSQFLANELRGKKHILPAEQEEMLAKASEVLNAASGIFGKLSDADMKFPEMKNEEGETVQLSHSRFGKYLESQNREVRKSAFKGLYSSYRQFANTLAATLSTNIKRDNFEADVRKFSNARESALFVNNIPESVYDNLVATVHEHLPLLHRYVELRKKTLGLEDIYPYDLYVSLIPDVDRHYTFDEALDLITKALAPLGEKYASLLKEAREKRWIDYAENEGKRSGAYSSGGFGTAPYILMSWQGTLDNVYTLAHELGHSMHTWFTTNTQPYVYANYCIFLAEIASTTNENLLTHYLLETETDPTVRRYVINNYLDGFKGTMFRQTQFAEFEHIIHKADQEGTPLTAEWLSDQYGKLNAEIYGPALSVDADIALEWSRIPHFYYNYYVFQYSTGFSAATAFAQAIITEGQPAVDRYLGFLSAGRSKYPIDVLKEAGLDMTSPEPIRAALKVFAARLEELEKM